MLWEPYVCVNHTYDKLRYLHSSSSIVSGPGRDIIVNGMSSLLQNRPDMNTLVGLGATASFGVSCVAAALPHLGWKTFFEEPAMRRGL